MSLGPQSPNTDTNLGGHCGHSGFESVRRFPAIQQDSWEFRKLTTEGSVMPNALVAWDVDGDGVQEIILGTTEGDLLVVKPEHRKPIFSRVLEATISVVLYSEAHRRLVLVTLEGQCEVTEAFLTGSCGNQTPSFTAASYARSYEGVRATPLDGNRQNNNCSPTSQLLSSYRFSIPLNCTCGDITTEEDGTMVFLGSDDRRVYVYSITSDGKCIGSLFLHAGVSSMRCFAAPFAADKRLPVMNTTPLIPQTVNLTHAAAGAPLLLVSSCERIILLNASRADVEQWGDPSLSRSIAVYEESERCIPVKDAHSSNTADRSSDVDPLVLDEIANPGKAFLKPLWHVSMDFIPQLQRHRCLFCMYERRTHIGTFASSLNSHKFSSQDTFFTLPRDESLASVNKHQKERGNTARIGSVQWGENHVSLLAVSGRNVCFPVAVAVAAGKYKLQFAAATEDGRWVIFEILPRCKASSTEMKVSSGHIHNETGLAVKGDSVSLICIAFGHFGSGELIPRVRVFCDKNDRFRAIFVASNGNCYVVDGNNRVAVESHVKADASSFTILTGESINQPKNLFSACANCVSTHTTTTSCLYSVREGLGLSQTQQNMFSGSISRTFFVVCVTVDELVVSSVDREAHLAAQQCARCRAGINCGVLQPSLPFPITQSANKSDSAHEQNMPKNGCYVSPEPGTHVEDETNAVDEEEEELMLRLGIALFIAEGFADPSALFSPEELRFAARKLCALGYSQEEWELLRRMEEDLSE